MKELVLEMPSMYGDHHVLRVKETLMSIDGVKEIYASSAWKQVMISFDPKKVTEKDLEKALSDAGYPPNEGAPPVLVHPTDIKRDPQWELLGVRTTKTNPIDLK
jgi:copper chaperone CopZ